MAEALGFFRALEVWIYLLLGLGALVNIRRFFLAWQELRGAGFGLERASAQSRLNQAASVLVLIITMAVTEFVLVSFIAPTVPGAIPLLTPTLNLLATPTTTLPVSQATGEFVPTTTPLPAGQTGQSGCVPGQVEITAPQNGQEVSGVVEIIGTANIPNFDFYKYEMKRPDETTWATIQAGNMIKQNEKLGDWDTRRLFGEYELSLVVVDDNAQSLPACIIKVFITRPADETPEAIGE